jgi:histidyl-tRNA synthetase
MIKAVRGTRDLLPPDTALWNHVESVVRDVFRAYNFQEIRTPIFESTELFARGVGEETDIVAKEMFTWFDRGDDPETVLRWAWWGQDGVRYEGPPAVQVSPQTGQLAFVHYDSNGGVKIITTSIAPNLRTAIALRDIRSRWVAQHGLPMPSLAVAVPMGNVPGLELQDDIEIIPIRMPPEFERPQSLTLRPEATAGIVRAYIEHKLWDRGLNKLYCMGPMFRRERPQKGRYRQFYQIDAEVIGPASAGGDSPARDAEVLEMLATLLDRLGITGWNLELNSVGCPNDRVAFNEALRKALEPVVGKMCADCQRRAVTNPLRVFDCKVPEDQPIIDTLPRISQFLDEPCRKHFEAVKEILTKVGVPFTLNDRLVRGLDYYTRTAFEFTHGALGAQNAILGGGRYDGLSEALGGPAAPGIGFAIGEDRLVMSLQESQSAESVLRKPEVYVAPLGEGMNAEAARLARELRRHDLVLDLGDETFRLKKSFEAADKAGAKYILIVGENEVKADAFALKNLATGEQISVPRAELSQRIKS